MKITYELSPELGIYSVINPHHGKKQLIITIIDAKIIRLLVVSDLI